MTILKIVELTGYPVIVQVVGYSSTPIARNSRDISVTANYNGMIAAVVTYAPDYCSPTIADVYKNFRRFSNPVPKTM